jgi:hypothetical protein
MKHVTLNSTAPLLTPPNPCYNGDYPIGKELLPSLIAPTYSKPLLFTYLNILYLMI